MRYASPNTAGAKVHFKAAYDNFINGKFVPPVKGQYFDVITPITGQPYTRAARSGAEDIELALDAAHAAADAWGRTSPGERANVLLKIADRLEQNLEALAYAETYRAIENAVQRICRERDIGVVIRATSDSMDSKDRSSVLQAVNRPVVYTAVPDLTADVIAALNKSSQ